MTKGELLLQHRDTMSADDRCQFDRWLKANTAIATLFSIGLIAMAIMSGSNPSSPRTAAAESFFSQVDVSSAAKHHVQNDMLSVEELTIRTPMDQLPVQRVDEPY
jgi:hypothetical protein